MTFDPNWWPLASGLGMMAPARNHNHKERDDPDDGWPDAIRTVLKLLHGGATVSLLIFGFQQYEAAQAWRSRMETRVEVLVEQLKQQEANHVGSIAAMTQRIEVQRQDIRALQEQLSAHKDDDTRSFNRLRGHVP